VEREGPVHTLRHPILSYLAARAFFPGDFAPLPMYIGKEYGDVSRRNSLLRRYGGVSDTYGEELLEAGARESCRFFRMKECATFFARWAYDHPESPRLRTVLAEVRRSVGAPRQADLAPSKIADVQRLFDRKFGASRLPYARVRELVRLYATHYNHVVPFDEDVLEDIWSRCHDLRCGTTRRQVERMLEEGSWDLPPIAERSVVTRTRRSSRNASPTTPDFSPEPETTTASDFSPEPESE
jgi:hypothetical protein